MGFTGRSTTGPLQHTWAAETQQCSPETGFVHKGEKILQGKAPLLWELECPVLAMGCITCREVGGQEGGRGWAGERQERSRRVGRRVGRGWAGSLPTSGMMELQVLPGNVSLETSQVQRS